MDPVNPEVIAIPDLDIPMIFDSPEEREMSKGIHKRIQVEIYHEDRERAFQAEERLDAPLGWNNVKDLIMDDGDILAENMKPEKRRREEKTKEGRQHPCRETRTFSDGVLQQSPRESSGRRGSTLNSLGRM